jgi:hypothetical protein
MTLTIKPKNIEKCNGCELCVLESQRQLKKVGLEESLIRVFSKRKENSEYLEHSIEIDPRVTALNLEKIKNICPREVFEVEEEE